MAVDRSFSSRRRKGGSYIPGAKKHKPIGNSISKAQNFNQNQQAAVFTGNSEKAMLIRQIQNRENMIVAYCQLTNMPLVVCDQETFNDQVWIFETEDQLKEFAQEYVERKIPLKGVLYENKDFLRFFSMLFMIGVNELVFRLEGGDSKIELTSLVNAPDYSRLKPEARPVINENLQLTGIYFMQEAGRPVPTEEKEDLEDLEEELAVNMSKARYIVPVILQDGPGTPAEKLKSRKYQVPIMKNQNGDVLQPIFTDPLELQKFQNGKQMTALSIPFRGLSRVLVGEASGYMLNPAGFHILMPRELLSELEARLDEDEEESSSDDTTEE